MSQHEFTINGRLEVVENLDPHGTWTVHDIETGRRMSGCARTLGDLADILDHLERLEQPEEQG